MTRAASNEAVATRFRRRGSSVAAAVDRIAQSDPHASTCRYWRHSASVSVRVTFRSAISTRSSRSSAQTRTTPSAPIEASSLPSGENVTLPTPLSWPRRTTRGGARRAVRYPHRRVTAARGDQGSVRRELRVHDDSRVSAQRRHHLAARRVEHLGAPALDVRGQDRLAIGCEHGIFGRRFDRAHLLADRAQSQTRTPNSEKSGRPVHDCVLTSCEPVASKRTDVKKTSGSPRITARSSPDPSNTLSTAPFAIASRSPSGLQDDVVRERHLDRGSMLAGGQFPDVDRPFPAARCHPSAVGAHRATSPRRSPARCAPSRASSRCPTP